MSRTLGGYDALTVVVGVEGDRGGVASIVGDLAMEPAVVDPVDVAESGELDVVEAAPGAVALDELPLVEPVEALGQGVLVAIALGAHRGDDVVLLQAIAVADRQDCR